MTDASPSSVFLKPGEYYYVRKRPAEPIRVITIVGSCLAPILQCRGKGPVALWHAFLPSCEKGDRCLGDCPTPFRYVRCGFLKIMTAFSRRTPRIRQIDLKIFGGAEVFLQRMPEPLMSAGNMSVGTLNIRMAEKMAEAYSIQASHWDVGGRVGRKIIFDPVSGDISVRKLKSMRPCC